MVEMKVCCKETDLKVRKEFLKVMETLSKLPPYEIQRVIKIVVQTTKEVIEKHGLK